jgi:hypothetical protein
VDGEVGRFEFATHSTIREDGLKYNTAVDLFSGLKGKELYRTIGFKEISMIHGDTEKSYRKTTKLINRVRYQEKGGTPCRTLQENTEKEGSKIISYIGNKTKRILKEHGFNPDGIYLKNNDIYYSEVHTTSEDVVSSALEKCTHSSMRDEVRNNPLDYEDPDHAVNISIDDVNVKKQEELRSRRGNIEKGGREYVHNTVVHISKGNQSYNLNGFGIKNVLCFVMAFLLNNGLMKERLQFFTDGHKTLNDTILKCFNWLKNIAIILDWYHLEKKCKEQLSMAMKGREIRNNVLKQLMPLLWQGLTERAVALLHEVDDQRIKQKAAMEKLVEYLRRNKPYIPCYAARKELGLRNSSNIGEKMNDLIVSERQKHNGMSWSKPGSVALASVTAVKRNKESKKWFEEGEIEFKLVANSAS